MVRLTCGALSCWVVLWLLGGCYKTSSPWRDLPPPTTLLSNPGPIWQSLEARRQSLHDLKGIARVRIHTPVRNASLEEVVVVLQAQSGLRLEGIGPFGQPLFLFIAHDQRLALYAPQEGRLLSGAATDRNSVRLLGLALTPHALQYVLLGDIPLTTLPMAGDFAYLAADNLYRWQGSEPQQQMFYRIWFEPYHLQPVHLEMTDARGQLVLQVDYDDFQALDGLMLPYRIAMAQPTTDRQVVWQYHDVQLNTGVVPALFRMQVPVGTDHIELEDPAIPQGTILPRLW